MKNRYNIQEGLLHHAFLEAKFTNPLRVCCYGSSSELTPPEYLAESYMVGYVLARRGHTCVNGAGMFGCMAAMNHGADDGNGHIVGVIHEMFIVDGMDWVGGSHEVFQNRQKRELLIASGKDLQERKRLLVDQANAVIVCPGGPGTWDELWEMACSRNINLIDIPIVCVNVNGFYDPFIQMLDRAYKDQLIKKKPSDIVHFVQNGLQAVEYVEQYVEQQKRHDEKNNEKGSSSKLKLRSQKSFLKRPGSMMSLPPFWSSIVSSFMDFNGNNTKNDDPSFHDKNEYDRKISWPCFVSFMTGMTVGAITLLKIMSLSSFTNTSSRKMIQ